MSVTIDNSANKAVVQGTDKLPLGDGTGTPKHMTLAQVATYAIPDLSSYALKTTTVNGHALSANVTVTASDLSLGNVNNTSDINKPVSTAQQAAIDAKVADAINNGVTTIAPSQNAVFDALATKADTSSLSGYVTTGTTVNGHALSSNVTVSASDVGLSNVDNTSDANKPVSTAQSTAIGLKVTANGAITGATKTKVTYDTKGLITSGADATTADIADSSNKRYVSDAQLTVLGNTSGTNTGDQTNITGNAATVTTNANLTGVVTSSGNATSFANSVALPGSPTTTTQTAGDNSTKVATTAYADRMFSLVALPTYNSTIGLTDRIAVWSAGVGECIDPGQLFYNTLSASTSGTPVAANSIPYVDSFAGISRVTLTNLFGGIPVDTKISTVGKGLYIKEGTNATMGVATLVAGTVTVSTTKVTANSRIFLTRQTTGGTLGSSVDVTARSAGTSFTITSNGSILDTSTVAWVIVEPA